MGRAQHVTELHGVTPSSDLSPCNSSPTLTDMYFKTVEPPFYFTPVIVLGIIHTACLARFIGVSLGNCRPSGTRLVCIHRACFSEISNFLTILKKIPKYSFLVWARNTFFQTENMFSFTFWQLHCKAKQQDTRAHRAWTSSCLLSPRCLELGFAESTVSSSLEQKRWACGSVLLVRSWSSMVNAIWLMQ